MKRSAWFVAIWTIGALLWLASIGSLATLTGYGSASAATMAQVTAHVVESGTVPPVEPARPVRYAKPDGLTSGACNNWGTACQLGYALELANNDEEVWVQAGIYKPANAQDRTATFPLKNGLAVYGGFAGTESQRSQRNPALNPTILSGDIGAIGNASDNCYHVVTVAIGEAKTILEGVIIQDGNADGSSTNGSGGGLYVLGGNLSLVDVTFANNSARNGGGVYGRDSNLTLYNIQFNANRADYGGGAYSYTSAFTVTNASYQENSSSVAGGAIYNRGGAVLFTNSLFANNTSALSGGGIYNTTGNSTTLVNSRLVNNVARYYGGALYSTNSNTDIAASEFTANSASFYGGGLYLNVSRSAEISYTTRLTDTLLADNTSNNLAGAIYAVRANLEGNGLSFFRNTTKNNGGALYSVYSTVTMTRIAVAENRAKYGGAFYNDTSTLSVSNATVYSNTATVDGGAFFGDDAPTEIAHLTAVGNVAEHYGGTIYSILSAPTVRNSIFWGNTAEKGSTVIGTATFIDTIVEEGCPIGVSCDGVSGDDPLLGAVGNHGGGINTIPILTGSPAIDRATDFCPQDDARTVTRPQGAGCDLGAYETRGLALAIVSGDRQQIEVYELYPLPLVVSATSIEGHAVDGAQVTFSSAVDEPGVTPASQTKTFAGGQASAAVTANPFAGDLLVEARAPGSQPVYFSLHNRDTPVAGLRASHSNIATVDQAAHFTASVQGGTNVSFRWDFGDGATLETTENHITHVYTVAGAYPISVTAFNEAAHVTMTLSSIEVYDVALAGLTAHNDSPTIYGAPTQFWASTEAGTGVHFAWNFGDGGTGSGESVMYVYTAPGAYTATVTASNGVNSAMAQIHVLVEEAIQDVVLQPQSGAFGQVGRAVSFSIEVGAGNPTSVTWRFGDELHIGALTSTDGAVWTSIEHVYAAPGVYQVIANVANSVSQYDVFTTVEISDVPISEGFIEWQGTPEILEPLEFTGQYADGTSVRCVWDFDDATQPTEGCEVEHTYRQVGRYTVKLWLINTANVKVVRTDIIITDPTPGPDIDHWHYLPFVQSETSS